MNSRKFMLLTSVLLILGMALSIPTVQAKGTLSDPVDDVKGLRTNMDNSTEADFTPLDAPTGVDFMDIIDITWEKKVSIYEFTLFFSDDVPLAKILSEEYFGFISFALDNESIPKNSNNIYGDTPDYEGKYPITLGYGKDENSAIFDGSVVLTPKSGDNHTLNNMGVISQDTIIWTVLASDIDPILSTYSDMPEFDDLEPWGAALYYHNDTAAGKSYFYWDVINWESNPFNAMNELYAQAADYLEGIPGYPTAILGSVSSITIIVVLMKKREAIKSI